MKLVTHGEDGIDEIYEMPVGGIVMGRGCHEIKLNAEDMRRLTEMKPDALHEYLFCHLATRLMSWHGNDWAHRIKQRPVEPRKYEPSRTHDVDLPLELIEK